MRCGNLTKLPNVIINYTPPRVVSSTLPTGQRYIGTIATYSYLPGYQLVRGSSLRTCGPDGSWNGIEPSCESKDFYFCLKVIMICTYSDQLQC